MFGSKQKQLTQQVEELQHALQLAEADVESLRQQRNTVMRLFIEYTTASSQGTPCTVMMLVDEFLRLFDEIEVSPFPYYTRSSPIDTRRRIQ